MKKKFMTCGYVEIDPSKVVGIERGGWSDIEQDWIAILVMHGNTRIDTGVYIKRVLAALETYEA